MMWNRYSLERCSSWEHDDQKGGLYNRENMMSSQNCINKTVATKGADSNTTAYNCVCLKWKQLPLTRMNPEQRPFVQLQKNWKWDHFMNTFDQCSTWTRFWLIETISIFRYFVVSFTAVRWDRFYACCIPQPLSGKPLMNISTVSKGISITLVKSILQFSSGNCDGLVYKKLEFQEENWFSKLVKQSFFIG